MHGIACINIAALTNNQSGDSGGMTHIHSIALFVAHPAASRLFFCFWPSDHCCVCSKWSCTYVKTF